ncbi:unnamed protein product [Litomosoides sigmodontis]|uniref:Uncharacterized protein n=1 Tax=Litomosoides sigmodontis TaxID=42156 RepID=A0A3P6UZY8_LITSI|nr:unnamed protein product [Litomosoides sigmodontis]
MPSHTIDYPTGCKPINTNIKNTTELLKRLKTLSETLKCQVTNEEANTPNRYKDLMFHLTDSQFLNNKNRDVQLLLACCIADLFRIFAPNSPIKNLSVIKDVLLFLTAVIGNVPEKGSSMYQYYLYFLEDISVVETMQIALELKDDAYMILRQLIKQSLNSISEKTADERIQGMLMGMCSKLIQGVDQISNIVLDAIFFYIVQPQRINNREAYFMARDLIRTNQTTLEPYVALLLKRGLETGILDDCELISPKKLYDLICQLHKFAPEMISSTLPILVDQMNSEDVDIRRETVRLFGNLFGDRNSRMAEDEPEVWNEYMKRFTDVNEEVRRICTRNAEDILVFHPELSGQVTDAVISRCQDVDENVRLEVFTMVQGLAKRKFEALNERLLTHVIDRIRDKKVRVRHAVIRGLSHLHRTIFSNDELTDLERCSFSSIFSAIMNHYYQPLPEDRLLTEKIFVLNLIPYKLDESKRMGILVNVFLNMNNYGIKALEQIMMKQSFQRRLLHNLVKLVERSVEPQKGKTVDDVIRGIVECNPEPAKFSLLFKQFMTHLTNDKQMLLSLKYITGKEYSCQKVELAVLEILQRLRDYKVSVECLDAVRCLFECCSPLQFDGIAVSVLVDIVITLIRGSIDCDQSNRCRKLIKLLKIVADAYPHCFVNGPTLENLIELMQIESFSEIESLLALVISISAELQQNHLLAKDMIGKYVKHCEYISLNGTPRAAKYAVRCISKLLNIKEARARLEGIVQNSLSHISESDPQCCTALKALSSCVQVDTVQFCNELLEILKTKVMDLLLDRSSSSIIFSHHSNLNNCSEQVGDEAICDENYVEIKKHCLKFVANFLVSVAQFSECDVEPLAKNLLKLYSTLLETKGDIFEKPCGRAHMAEFRILAGSSMLKLATKPRYAKFVTADNLITLSALGRDEESEMRHRFFAKLNKHLMALQLHVEYMGLFALVSLYEDAGFQNKVRVLIDANITKRRKYLERSEVKVFAPYYQPEYCIAYAIYILAKLPSFDSIKCEPELRRSIWFLLEIFSARNEPGSLEFIYNIFNTIKNSTDSKLQDCTREELQQKNEANTKVYIPASFVKQMKSKKSNTKYLKTNTTKDATKSFVRRSLINNPKRSTKASSDLKIAKGSKREINKKYMRSNRGDEAQASDLSSNNDIHKDDTKRLRLVSEEEAQQDKLKISGTKSISEKNFQASGDDNSWGLEKEAPLLCDMSMKDRKEIAKRSASFERSNNDSKPGTSEANSSSENGQNIHGSLEDCDYSPIRPVHVINDSSTRQAPFTSSTPIVTAKRHRAFISASENSGATKPNLKCAEGMTTKKLRKVNPKNDYAKIRKLDTTENAKSSGRKARAKMVRETSGIATRLRSRQAVISFSAQHPSVESIRRIVLKAFLYKAIFVSITIASSET